MPAVSGPQKTAFAGSQRYIGIVLYNYDEAPGYGLDQIDNAIRNGSNLIEICVHWDKIYANRSSSANWSNIDAQIQRARQMGAKVAIRIATAREFDRVGGFWTDQERQMSSDYRLLYRGRMTHFSFAAGGPMQLARNFCQEVTNRYQYLRNDGSLLFMSVVPSPILEGEYSTLNTDDSGREYFIPGDYSPIAIQAFRQWLQGRFSLQQLNARWGSAFGRWEDVGPLFVGRDNYYAAFSGQRGQDWWVFRNMMIKRYFDTMNSAIKGVNGSIDIINQHGSSWDSMSSLRGTLAFKSLQTFADGVKLNDAPEYNHRWSMDLVRSNVKPGGWVGTEIDGLYYQSVPTEEFFNQIAASFEHGAQIVLFANFASVAQQGKMNQILARVNSSGLMRQSVPSINPSTTMYCSLGTVLRVGYAEGGFTGQWNTNYQNSGRQPVRVILNEDILSDAPAAPENNTQPAPAPAPAPAPTPVASSPAPAPSSGSFAITTPTYDCNSGSLRMNVSGGNGTTQYMIPGLRGWSSSPDFNLPSWQRNGTTFTLFAQQNGQEVSFSYTTSCSNSAPAPTPVASSPAPAPSSGSFAITTPTYDCNSGSLRMNVSGGNGATQYMIPGLRGWSSSPDFNLPSWQRNGTTFTLFAQQNGQEVSFSYTTSCSNSAPAPTPVASSPAPAPSSGSFAITIPTYDCNSGSLRVNVSGGNGATQYMIPGLRGWGSSPDFMLPSWQRTGTTFTIFAQQNGQQVTFSYTTSCSNSAPVTTSFSVSVSTSTSFAITAPSYDCNSGSLRMNVSGGNGATQYMIPGLRGWGSSPDFNLPSWQRNGTTFTLYAQQNGREVTMSYTTGCGAARIAAVAAPPTAEEKAAQWSVRPNPVVDRFVIDVPYQAQDGASGLTVSLNALNGAPVLNQKADYRNGIISVELSGHQLTPGLYIVTVYNSGRLVKAMKVVKQ